MTLHNPPGARQLAAGINTNHLFTLFFAALEKICAYLQFQPGDLLVFEAAEELQAK